MKIVNDSDSAHGRMMQPPSWAIEAVEEEFEGQDEVLWSELQERAIEYARANGWEH